MEEEKNIIDDLKKYLETKAKIDKLEYDIRILEMKLEKMKNDPPVSGSNFDVNGDIRPNGFMKSTIEEKIAIIDEEIYKAKKKKNILEAKIKMLDSILNTLKSSIRELVVDIYINNISIKDIAERRNRQPKSVSRTIHNAVRKLNILYNNKDF